MKNPLRQLIKSAAKDAASGIVDFGLSRRNLALRDELQRRATIEAADMVQQEMQLAQYCADKHSHLEFAIQERVPGLVLEFGVYKGTTLNHLADRLPDDTIYGFDSFEGLPEAWAGNRYSTRNFNRHGKPPEVRGNVELVIGWFNETLGPFLQKHDAPLSIVHIDCDIYSSTNTVFLELESRIQDGTIIVFDEYFNYHSWQLHEYKAFMELIERTGLEFDYIGYSGAEVSVRMKTRSQRRRKSR